MINNFNLLESLLQFDNSGDCYFLQILKRKKDNLDMNVNMAVIDNMLIYSLDNYRKKQDRIVDICTKNNARAYLRINRRNTERLALLTMAKVCTLLLNKNYEAVKNAYWSVACESNSEPVKRWIVDIDKTVPPHQWETYVSGIRLTINELHDECNRNGNQAKYVQLLEIPTKNGMHIITNPFNVQKFKQVEKYKNIDLHRDNPTILYCP